MRDPAGVPDPNVERDDPYADSLGQERLPDLGRLLGFPLSPAVEMSWQPVLLLLAGALAAAQLAPSRTTNAVAVVASLGAAYKVWSESEQVFGGKDSWDKFKLYTRARVPAPAAGVALAVGAGLANSDSVTPTVVTLAGALALLASF